VHYSARLPVAEFPSAVAMGMPPVTWPHEAVFDLVNASATAEDAVAWAITACQRKKTTPDMITMCLLRPGHRQLRWGDELREALTEIRAGVQSPLEQRYLRDVEQAHRLPKGERQVKTLHKSNVQYHDVRYVDFDVCIELDGVRWHADDTRGRDSRRDNSNLLAGIETLRYGWLDVAYHPCEVAQEVWSLLVRHGYYRDFQRCGSACAPPENAALTVKAWLDQAKRSRS